MFSFEECSSLIEERIKQLDLDGRAPAGLYEPIDYVMAAGGKRIRPALTLMSCNLFDDNIEKALMPAIALEIFHNFTLLHDDLMDNADVRRNRPTVHKRWNENSAILSGDAMLILAYQYMCSSKLVHLPLLLDTFTITALNVCEGQQFDMDFEQRDDVTIDEYLNMIRLKTAALLASCLKIGAICGGANKENSEALYNFGLSLGMSFQLQDDWLDVYADPNILGKSIGGDILNRKKSFLLLTAFAKADEKNRKKLDELLNDNEIDAKTKIKEVKAIYDRLELSELTLQEIENYYQQTMSHLQRVDIPDKTRKFALELFALKLLKREK